MQTGGPHAMLMTQTWGRYVALLPVVVERVSFTAVAAVITLD